MNELYFWVGLVVVNVTLGVLWIATGYMGKFVWNRITRIYSITVITYWLERLEREGLRCFEKAKNGNQNEHN